LDLPLEIGLVVDNLLVRVGGRGRGELLFAGNF